MSDEFSTGQAPRSRRRKGKSKPDAATPALIGGGIVVVLMVVAFLFRDPNRNTLPPPPLPPPPGPSPQTSALVPAVVPTGPVRLAPVKPQTEEVVRPAPPGLWTAESSRPIPDGEPISLLNRVDLARDAFTGQWQRTPSGLTGSAQSSLYLPAELPDDYQLTLTVHRLDGTDPLNLGFMMSGRQGVIALGGGESSLSGLYVDQLEPFDNDTTRAGKVFQAGPAATIVLTVHPGHLQASADETTIVDWHGDPGRLSVQSSRVPPCREAPFVWIENSRVIIESATLVPLKPEPEVAQPSRLDEEIAVLPLVDLKRDARRGAWSLQDEVLTSPEENGRIYLPTVVPAEYTLSATVELMEGQPADYALGFGLVAQGSQFQFTATTRESGLEMIDGRRWNDNGTRVPGSLLTPGRPVQLEMTVNNGGVRVAADGKVLVDWRGAFRSLSIPGDWAMSDGRRLFLGTSCRARIRDLKLGPPRTPADSATPLPEKEPLDLLTVIEPSRDAVRGGWEKDGTSLTSRGDVQDSQLVIPVDLPADYKLTVRVSRIAGEKAAGDGLLFGLPMGQGSMLLAIDAARSTISGIHVDQTRLSDSVHSHRRGPVIPRQGARELEIVVTSRGLKVTSDGGKVIDWTGNPDRSTIPPGIVSPARRLWFGGSDQGFRFEKLQLQRLEASRPAAPAPPGADGRLLPILDVERDSRVGEWALKMGRLTGPATGPARLNLPVAAPERYVLSAKVERKQGGRELYLGLVVAGHPCAVSIDGDQMHQAGLDLLDGKRCFDRLNPTSRWYDQPLLPPNQVIPVDCYVLPDAIVVNCGGKEVVRWHGDPRRLSGNTELVPSNYSAADRECLWLGTWDSSFVIRDLELKPLTDAVAQQISRSFSGVFPTTLQRDVPLGEARRWAPAKK